MITSSTKPRSAQCSSVAAGRAAEKDVTDFFARELPGARLGGKHTENGEAGCRVSTPEGDANRIWDIVVGGAYIEVKHVETRLDSTLYKIYGQVSELLVRAHGLPKPKLPNYLRTRLSKGLCECAVANPNPNWVHVAHVCGECERLCTERDREKVRARLTPPPIIYVLHGEGAEDPNFLKKLKHLIAWEKSRGGRARDIANRIHLWTWTEMQQQGFLTKARRRLIAG